MTAKSAIPQTSPVRHKTPSHALPLALLAAAIFLLVPAVNAQTQYYWRSDAGSGSWDAANWWNGAAVTPGFGQLNFDNNSWTTMTNDSSFSTWRIYFAAAASSSRTVSGSGTISLYDYSSQVPVIRNDSSATMSLNQNFNVGNTSGGTTQSNNRVEIIAANGDLSFGGTLSTTTDGNLAKEWRFDAASGRLITVSGTITEANSSNALQVRKVSAGTLALTGSNAYTGATLIEAGAVVIGNAKSLGTADNGTTVTSGAALQLSNGISVSNEALTLAGSGISSGGALRSVSGSNAYTGLITANSATTSVGAASGATLVVGSVNSGGQELWVVGDGTTIVSGGATNSGSGTAFVKTNAGTAMLTASNAWSGNEYIREGTVVLSNNNAFGTGGTTYLGAADAGSSATATLTLGSGVINSNAISVEASGTGARTLGYQTSSGTGTQLGSITLNGGNSLAFNILTGGTMLFGGGVTSSGTNRLAVDGGGTLIVTNAGTGLPTSTNYQVRIGNGTLVIGAGTIISRTNVSGLGHALDLGVDLNGTIVNNTSTLAASNGITVSNSIYVSTTNNSARVLSVVGAGTATYSGPIALNNANLTVNATNTSDNVNITGAITNFSGSTTNNNGLIKTGAGTVTLYAANTFGGTTWVNAGVLRALTNASALSSTNASLVLNGGNLELASDTGLTFAKNIVLSNNGTITINRLTSGNGFTDIMGTLAFAGSQTLTLATGANLTSAPGFTFGAVTLGGATGAALQAGTNTVKFTNGITGSNTHFTVENGTGAILDISNAISIGSGSITKNGAGNLTLFSSNNFSGGIVFNAGKLNISNSFALGTGTLTLGTLGGSEVILNSGVTTNAQNNAMVWNSALKYGNDGGGSYHSGTNTVTLGTNVTVTVNNAGRNLTVGGVISGAFSLTKAGGQTLTLTAANTYSGGTIVSGGMLVLSGAGSLNSGGSLALTNGHFDISGIDATGTTVGSLASSGSIFVNLGSKTLTMGGDNTSTTFSGTISNTGSIVKEGSGTMTLGAANTYSGTTTINAGTLRIINAAGTIGTGNVTNNSVLDYDKAGMFAVSNAISGTGILRNIGTGTLVLMSSNSYIGGTAITNGAIIMSNNSALGPGTVTLGTPNVGATLGLGNGVTNSNAISVVPSATSGRGLAVLQAGDYATQLGSVYLPNTNAHSYLQFNVVTNATLLFGGGINVATNATTYYGRMGVEGGGSVILTNNGSATTNLQAFQMRIGDGTLVIGAGALNGRTDTGSKGIDLGQNSIGVATSASSSLYASNGVTVNESIYVTGPANTTPTRIMGIAGAGTATFGGIVSLTGTGLTVSAGSGGTAIFTNEVRNNNNTANVTNFLTKIGVGTVILAQTNTYSGATTISEGTLRVTGVVSNTPTVTVTNTGVLSGSGKIATGTTTIAAGGTISPGNSPGTIFLSNTVFGTNGNYNWQLYNATGTKGDTNGYDWISGNGSLTVSATAGDKFNINLWTLSGINPDTNGSAINFSSSGTTNWTLGTWTSIVGFDTNYFRINTGATNGTGGFANAFAGTFSLTSSNNSIFLNYAGAAGVPVYAGGSGVWSTGFSPALTQGATNAYFTGAGGNATNDIASGTVSSIGGITFSNSAGSYTLSASNGSAGYDTNSALAITGNIVNNSSNAQTVNLALAFNNVSTNNAASGSMTFSGPIANATNLTFQGASNTVVSGVISGNGTLTKSGTGTLTLSGSSANTYTNMTTVSAGVLEINKTGAEAIVGGVTVGSGSTDATVKLLIASAGQVSDTSAITLSGGTITRAGSVSEVFGNLNLTTASFLDYGSTAGGSLSFGTYTPSSLLTVQNFIPGDTLIFKSDLSGSISNASYFSFSGAFTSNWNSGSSTFTITAVPEASTVAAAIGLAGMMLWPTRRRLLRDAKSILGLRRPARDRMQQYRHS